MDFWLLKVSFNGGGNSPHVCHHPWCRQIRSLTMLVLPEYHNRKHHDGPLHCILLFYILVNLVQDRLLHRSAMYHHLGIDIRIYHLQLNRAQASPSQHNHKHLLDCHTPLRECNSAERQWLLLETITSSIPLLIHSTDVTEVSILRMFATLKFTN